MGRHAGGERGKGAAGASRTAAVLGGGRSGLLLLPLGEVRAERSRSWRAGGRVETARY